MANKQLPTPGAHVVWPAAAAGQPSPPAKGRGLARLRAQPGAEGVRQQVVAEQQAARAEAQAAPHHAVVSVLPFKVGSRVADQRVKLGLRVGKVLHTHVHVAVGGKLNGKPYPPLYGHVVHWGGDDVELVPPQHLCVVT